MAADRGEPIVKRVLVTQIPAPGTRFTPAGEELHHLIGVRRAVEGEPVEVLDGCGGLALGRLCDLRGRHATIEVLHPIEAPRESPLLLALALAIPVQLNLVDQMLPSLVQLGVNRIVIAGTAYSGRIKREAERYLTRLNEIARQSLKQCGRTNLPAIELARDWGALCIDFAQSNQANILFHPLPDEPSQAGSPNPTESLSNAADPAGERAKPQSLGLLIGPEGGFTEAEVANAREQGIQVKPLGPRILKMETAAIGATFWAQNHFGDLS